MTDATIAPEDDTELIQVRRNETIGKLRRFD